MDSISGLFGHQIQLNGTLEGNRTADLAAGANTSSQHGFGVVFAGCQHCAITGAGTIQDFLGDGVMIDKDWVSGTNSTDIDIGPILSTNSYRNNASVVNLMGSSTFNATRLTNANGTAPQSGIDIEPRYVNNAVGVVKLVNLSVTGNAGRGLSVQAPSGSGTIDAVQVVGGLFDSNLEGVEEYGTSINRFSVSCAKISNNHECGSYVQTALDGAVSEIGNYFIGNGSGTVFTDCPSSNALFQTSTGFEFARNTLRAGSNANKPARGLSLNSNTGVNRIHDNDLAGSAATATPLSEFGTYMESTRDYYAMNRLTTGQHAPSSMPTVSSSGGYSGVADVSTVTLGNATTAGTGATASCSSGYVCGQFSGVITLTTGTGITPAQFDNVVLTITFPMTRGNNPTCVINVENTSTGAMLSSVGPVSTTSTLAFYSWSSTAFVSSTNYSLFYMCGAN